MARGAFISPGVRGTGSARSQPWIRRDHNRPRDIPGQPITIADNLEQFLTRHVRPGETAETVLSQDDQQCVNVAPLSVRPLGWTVPGALLRGTDWAMMMIEEIVGNLLVDILDDDGDIVETIFVDGRDPCAAEVAHPTLDVEPLTWRWELTIRDISSQEVTPVQGNARLGAVLRSWDDARAGSQRPYREAPQICVNGYPAAQMWVTLYGASGYYAVRVTSGLSGYTQGAGPDGAARRNAETRN